MNRGRFIGRVSLDAADIEGYFNLHRLMADGYSVRVFLRDMLQTYPIAADSDQGWVFVRYWNRRGAAYTDVTLRGPVEIRIEKPSAPREPGTPWEW